MIVPHQAERPQILQGLLRSALVDGPRPLESAEDPGDLDIEQVRSVEDLTPLQRQVRHGLPLLPAQEKLYGR